MLTSLRYFVEVVDRHGFTAAANSLSVSQPTLTRSLQTLEQRIGSQLILRGARGVELTTAGHLVLVRARMMLAEQDSMLKDLQAIKKRLPQSVSVNAAPITSMYLLPAVIRRLATEEPHMSVSITGALDSDYVHKQAAILDGEIDIALTLHQPENAINGLAQELLIEPEIKLLARAGHPAARGTVTLDQLREYTWIIQGPLTRAAMETEFTCQGLPLPASVVEMSDWTLAFKLAEVSDHVVITPYHPALLGDLMTRFVSLRLKFEMRPHALAIVYRPISARRHATRRFIAAVQEFVQASVAQTPPVHVTAAIAS